MTQPATGVSSVSVSELHQLIRRAGADRVWVQGTVSGLRPGPKFTTWELVEYQTDATTVAADV